MMPIVALRHLLDITGSLLAAGTTTIKLFQNDVEPTPDMVFADFTEADYTGYADIDVVAVPVAWDEANGDAALSFEGCHFQPTGSATTNTIYGYYMITGLAAFGGADSVLKAERFPAPIPMLGTMDAIDMVPILRIGQPLDD